MKMKLYKLVRDVVTPSQRVHTESITTFHEGMQQKADWLGRDRWFNDNRCLLHVKPKVYWCRTTDWYSKVHLIPLQ